jgi:hypothetical protein
MRNLAATAALVLTLSCLAGTALFAQDGGARKPAGGTSAPETAEAWFAALRKAATDKDEATLAKGLPAALVKDWPDEAAGDAKKWRDDFAAQIAAGTVVSVKDGGDDAVARWKTDKAVWETRLHRSGGRWSVASPWAWLVGGADLAKVNGAKPAHVKLKARTINESYGQSGFSFVHATADGKQCLNRVDMIFCRCGQVHGRHAMFSLVRGKKLADFDGLPGGADMQDEIVPKNGAVYLVHLSEPGRKDLIVAIELTTATGEVLEFDWRVVSAGKGCPPSTRTSQPIPWSKNEADAVDGVCGAK